MCHAKMLQASLLVGVLTAACGGENYVKGPSAKPPAVQSLAQAIVTGAFIVEPRTFKPFKIEVSLLTEAQFANWENRRAFEATYVSGRVTSGNIAVALPTTPGTYFVVFSNRFSIFSNKAVTADVQLRYDGR